jgi:hypothetical protein
MEPVITRRDGNVRERSIHLHYVAVSSGFIEAPSWSLSMSSVLSCSSGRLVRRSARVPNERQAHLLTGCADARH